MLKEISTEESVYITTLAGDTYLLEVRENNGSVVISFGDKFSITLPENEAYEMIDVISLVLSSTRELS
tara:strand:- start:307 stop:510 length:204 start_codon:yes stop_codon:yes gene_type:complete